MSSGDIIFLFLFFWVLFVTARLFVYAVKIDIRVKKRVWPIIIVGLGVMLLWFAWILHFPTHYYWALILGVGVIVFINLRGFYFCEPCNRMFATKQILSPPTNCEKCRRKLVK